MSYIAAAIIDQGCPWPKWAGGGAPDKMAPPVVRGGAPKTPKYLVLKGSKNLKYPKIALIYLTFSRFAFFRTP